MGKFIWDLENTVQETDGSNTTQVTYTLGPALYGDLVSQRRGTTTRYHHFDGVGSTDRLTDSSAMVTDSYVYDAFGNIRASSGATTNPLKYVGALGYYADVDLSECYVRARYYAMVSARWLSRDPLGPRYNRAYEYVQNNSPNHTDPSGMWQAAGKIKVTNIQMSFDGQAMGKFPCNFIGGKEKVAFGFYVKIQASGDITKVMIKQEIFHLGILINRNKGWTSFLTDAKHDNESVMASVADTAIDQWNEFTFTLGDDKQIAANIFKKGLDNFNHGMDFAEYFDAPGYPGPELDGKNVPGNKFNEFHQRAFVKVTATGEDGIAKNIVGGWRYEAVCNNNIWSRRPETLTIRKANSTTTGL